MTYYSETGNTEKLARAIYDGIKWAVKGIVTVKEAPKVEHYDVIFCGFPVHASSVPPKVEPFLKGVDEGKMLAIFATHGSLREGSWRLQRFIMR